ncbi:MAG TPA: hypothetical protein VNI57_06195, partial [Candidatus Saccharimonadales bacterium]|nr:hypothetical protein [Candidatus Saccharimonadales bacterium]
AQAQWDLKGSASARETWADNVDYSSVANSDPNSKAGPTGDALSSIDLAGIALYEAARWHFSGNYSARGALYRDRTELNRVSHQGSLRSDWDLSRTTRLRFADSFQYTPDQGVNTNNVQSPVVITDYSSRRGNSARLELQNQLSGVSTFTTMVQHQFQSFANPDLADYAGSSGEIRWVRETGSGGGFDLDATLAYYRFSRRLAPDPNSGLPARTDHTGNRSNTLAAGGHVRLGRRFTGRALLGYDLVFPDRADRPTGRGFHTQTSIQWRGDHLQTDTGYYRTLSAGSGTFSVSWTETWFASLVASMGRRLKGNLYLNRSYSEGVGGRPGNGVLTNSGHASLDVALNTALSGLISFSRSVQSVDSRSASNITFDRYTIGLVARFD